MFAFVDAEGGVCEQGFCSNLFRAFLNLDQSHLLALYRNEMGLSSASGPSDGFGVEFQVETISFEISLQVQSRPSDKSISVLTSAGCLFGTSWTATCPQDT
jgi:hypothetical protein